jgi:MoaA/NifB/PqqE/SkfB family radical SAM enzyme
LGKIDVDAADDLAVSGWEGAFRGQPMIGKALRLMLSTLLRRPVLCLWQVTGRCQLACRICDFWRDDSVDLDLAACERVVRTLRGVAPLMLTLAGGEPFLREDLPDLVRLGARDHYCSVVTNGYLVTREKARSLWQAGLQDAVVSIDYATPARHDNQRGQEGAFSRALSAVEHFQMTRPNRGNKVRINAVVMEETRDELEGLLLLAEELDVSVSFTLYSDRLGKKAQRKPETPIVPYLLALRTRHPRRISSAAAYLAKFDAAVAGRTGACVGGRTFLNINPYGQLSRCIDRNDESLLDLLNASTKAVKKVLRTRHPDCNACFTACRALGDVSTGLRGLPAAVENLRMRL